MTIISFDGFFLVFAVASFPGMQTARLRPVGPRSPSDGQRKEVLRQKRYVGRSRRRNQKDIVRMSEARSVSTRLTDV